MVQIIPAPLIFKKETFIEEQACNRNLKETAARAGIIPQQ
jgi:hypothetical protein